MPMPQRVRVVGNLDMIRLSSQGFELILDDGTLARGVLIEGDMAALNHWSGIEPSCKARPFTGLPADSYVSTPHGWTPARASPASGR